MGSSEEIQLVKNIVEEIKYLQRVASPDQKRTSIYPNNEWNPEKATAKMVHRMSLGCDPWKYISTAIYSGGAKLKERNCKRMKTIMEDRQRWRSWVDSTEREKEVIKDAKCRNLGYTAQN